jgi:hypothetical protein
MNRFFVTFAVTVAIFGLYLTMNYGVVLLAGEMRPYESVILEQQKRRDTRYGCIFNNDYISYKKQLYSLRRPDLVILGSSRTLQYAQSFFLGKMANCGLAANNVYTARQFLRFIQQGKTLPKTVIFGIDHWWFVENLKKVEDAERWSAGSEMTFGKLYQPLAYAIQGKIPFSALLRGADLRNPGERTDGRIGLAALGLDGGFFYDGSRRYGTNMIKPMEEIESFDTVGMQAILAQPVIYEFASDYRRESVELLFSEVTALRKKGVNVVVFVPPVFPEYYRFMISSGEYGYVPMLLDRLREKYGVHAYVDPGTLGLSASDFHDLIHTRPAVSAKIILDLMQSEPCLRNIVNVSYLKELIQTDPRR